MKLLKEYYKVPAMLKCQITKVKHYRVQLVTCMGDRLISLNHLDFASQMIDLR